MRPAIAQTHKVQTQTTEHLPRPYLLDSLPLNTILVNGHSPLLTIEQFYKVYPKKSHVKKSVWECGSPFDSLDKDWMIKTYGPYDQQHGTFKNYDGQISTMTVNAAEYATNGHIVLLVNATSASNTLTIPSHRIKVNSKTETAEFEKLFRNVRPEETEDTSIIRYRIPIKHDYDDAFLFYFKDGKFDHIDLWFLLC